MSLVLNITTYASTKLLVCLCRQQTTSEHTRAYKSMLKHLMITTTRESHFHVFQNTVTLAKTPN